MMESASEEDGIRAPVVALDLGQKRIGVAVSDPLAISITRLPAIPRSNWKQLLKDVVHLIQRFDAKTVVIGLPLRLNGSRGDAAIAAAQTADKFARSLEVGVYLQDERLSSVAAEENLRDAGLKPSAIGEMVDSESAAIILRDFLQGDQKRVLLRPS